FTFTKDLQLAEDYAQEAFIQGLNKIDSFDSDKSQIQTWITVIARNLAKKGKKDEKKMPKVSMDKTIDEDNTSLSTFIPYDDGKEKIEEQKETYQKYNIVLKAIENLPSKYKEVIVMREIENMPYKDIADKLDRNLSTIKSQIRKGRHLIQSNVKPKFNFINENGVN
ncbi:MAG: RNA polymerase sigma factor, partial [archaeon]